MSDAITRRCGCRENGKQLGSRCPKLRDSRHGKWSFRVWVPGEGGTPVQIRKSGYDTKAEAKAARADIVAKASKKAYVAVGRKTVDEYLDEWLARKADRQPATVRHYQDALRPVRAVCGQRRLVDLDAADVERVKAAMLDGSARRVGAGTGKEHQGGAPLSPRSVNATLTALRSALDFAVNEGKVARNVARLVEKVPQSHGTAPRAGAAWDRDQVAAFKRAAAEDRLHAAWLLSLAGLRRSEVLGLRWEVSDRWSWVDLDAGVLHIGGPEAVRTLVAGREVLKSPKTERGTRTLPLGDELRAALRALRTAQAKERLKAGDAYDGRGFVVVDQLGVPVPCERYSDRFAELVADAGVPRVRLHDLRHTSVSLMREAGVADRLVAAWHGHDESVMRGTYDHVGDLTAVVAARAAAGL